MKRTQEMKSLLSFRGRVKLLDRIGHTSRRSKSYSSGTYNKRDIL